MPAEQSPQPVLLSGEIRMDMFKRAARQHFGSNYAQSFVHVGAGPTAGVSDGHALNSTDTAAQRQGSVICEGGNVFTDGGNGRSGRTH